MTACPACRTELREDARFCVRCGLEVRPACPACGTNAQFLATMEPGGSPWCEGCGALRNRCETCGRPLLAGTQRCPDPQCGGRVLPRLPQHTGRRWDGRGSAVGWTWPDRWERYHPDHRAPVVEEHASAEQLHTTFAAHGRLFLWEGTTLLGLPSDTHTPTHPHTHTPLGLNGRPAAGVPFVERAALAGAGAVLALERLFLLTDLGGSGHTQALETGKPLAQVSGPGRWAGWSEDDGIPTLRYARVGDTWDALFPRTAETPPEAAPGGDRRLTLRDGRVYWPGGDGGAWRLDCDTGQVERVVEPAEGLRAVWAEPVGPQTAREAQGNITLGLGEVSGGRHPRVVPAGVGPLREVMALDGRVVVVGDRVTEFNHATGARLHEVLRPPGRWVDGVLVPAADGEARLLALTVEGSRAVLTALRVSSGATEHLWTAAGVEPRALLPVGESLYVAHSRGVVRLV